MTRERKFLHDIFASIFMGSPLEAVWKWADRCVFFNSKQSTSPRYDSSKSPWTRDFQDLPRDRTTREAFVMKSSQSGFTEAVLNIIRWMAKHWPGNVGYIINSDKKARRLSKIRLLPTLKDAAGDQLTDDPNDQSTFHIVLKNMEISVSGSGSANPFREIWYRLGVLDEPEDHELLKDGSTTYGAIQNRFTTVADALLLVIGKPQYAWGIVHEGFLKGTQEKWMVPCPHCGERIELLWDFLKFGHCRDLAEGWDLERVIAETYYECQCCHEPIHEGHKEKMVQAGEWQETPEEHRERAPNGRKVPREPGVRSFHISDLYSLFDGLSWGHLAQKWLMAHILQPSKPAQDAFQTEHMGRPIVAREMTIRDEAILNLRGGIHEEVDGVTQTLGHKFNLLYENNEPTGEELPITNPVLISVTADRQKSCVPYLVFCWDANMEAYLIDYGQFDDEDHFLTIKDREYQLPGGGEILYPYGGLIDSQYRQKDVWRMTMEAQASGFQMMPTRGAKMANFRGKNLRYIKEAGYIEEGWPIDLWEYGDEAIKADFYLGKIARRAEPRLWLPDPVPSRIITEWTSEKFVTREVGGRKKQGFVHDPKLGANDLGDCAKKQYVFAQIVAPYIPEWQNRFARRMMGELTDS